MPPPSDRTAEPWIRLSVNNSQAPGTPMAHIALSRAVLDRLGWEPGQTALVLRVGRDGADQPVCLELRSTAPGEIGRALRPTRNAARSGQFYSILPADMSRRLVSRDMQRWETDQRNGGLLRIDITGLFAKAEAVA